MIHPESNATKNQHVGQKKNKLKSKTEKLFLSLQMEVGRVLLLLTILLLVVAKYTTRSTPKTKDIDEISDISKI